MAGIKQVAEESGVSIATVSRIFNNKPNAANVDTRDRVYEAAKRLGYYPSAIGRGLRSRRMNTIGVIRGPALREHFGTDPFFSPILDGILSACRVANQKTLVFAEESWEQVDHRIGKLNDGHCDGFLFILPRGGTLFASELLEQKIPFVSIGQMPPSAESSLVSVDNFHVGKLATMHLIEQGHRRIAYFGGNANQVSNTLRRQGYLDALKCCNVTIDDTLIFEGSYHFSSGFINAKLAMDLPHPPTALFCADDWIALGALQALAEMNIRVPDEMSLVGVNDGMEAASSSPPLTTIRQPLRDMGEAATELLISHIDMSSERREMVFIGELISRSSVGPPHHK